MMGCGVRPAPVSAWKLTLNFSASGSINTVRPGEQKAMEQVLLCSIAHHFLATARKGQILEIFGNQIGFLRKVTYLFFRDRRGAETNEDNDNGGEDAEDERKVEVVQVLQHSRPSVLLTAGWCAINKLDDHPNETNSQPKHEAPESTLRKGKRREKVTAQYPWLKFSSFSFFLSFFSFFFKYSSFIDQNLLCLIESHTDTHQRRISFKSSFYFSALEHGIDRAQTMQVSS